MNLVDTPRDTRPAGERAAVAPMGWTGRLVCAVLLVGAAGFAFQGSRGDGGAYGACAVLVACAVFIASMRVVARAGEDALVVRMFPFREFRVPYQDIRSVTVMDRAVSAAGLGYRYLGPGERALLTGGPALTVEYAAAGVQVDTFHPAKQLSFSTPDPDGLTRAIAEGRGAASARG